MKKKNGRKGRRGDVVHGVERCKTNTRWGTGGVFKPSTKHIYLKVKLSIWIVDIKREWGPKFGDSNGPEINGLDVSLQLVYL